MPDLDHILVVEDDAETRELLTAYLLKNGCRASSAADGVAMWARLAEEKNAVDVIILDLMLPGEDGLSLCRKLTTQEETAGIPVIMLTARGEEMDRIIGLEMGADDYLPKPFSPRELLARIKSVLRRARAEPRTAGDGAFRELRFEGWVFHLQAQRLTSPDGVEVPLTKGEFALLHLFLNNPGRILDRDEIMAASRDREATVFDRAVDVQVARLRKRLRDDPKKPVLLKTVWGKGYLFDSEVEAR